MLHIAVEVGIGAPAVIAAAAREHQYRLACIKALKAGDSMPPPGDLPSVVASYVRHWAVRYYDRPNPVPSADVPVYHVPPRGWTLLRNGVSFVVVAAAGGGPTRATATFTSDVLGEIRADAMLALSKQAKGWLATFKEVGE